MSNTFSYTDEFERLKRFAEYHQGQFTLGLVRVNDPRQRNEIIQNLETALKEVGVQLIHVNVSNRHPDNLRDALNSTPDGRRLLQSPKHSALALTGLEHLIEATPARGTRPTFAAALNAERDLLRNGLPVPVMLFMTDLAMDRLDLNAPDFFDWYSATFQFHASGLSAARTEATTAGIIHQPPASPEDLRQRLEALEMRRRVLSLEKTESLPALASVLMQIGDLYTSLPGFADRQLAVSYFKQAARIYHQLDEPIQEADVLARLGEVHYWIDDYAQSAAYYLQAIETYEAHQKQNEFASCLQKLGDVHLQLSEIAAAGTRYQAALDIYREQDNLSGVAACIRSLGDVARLMGDYTLAEKRYRSALPIFRRAQNELGIANSIQSMGDVLLQQGEHRRAQIRYQEALELYIKIGNLLGQADCLQGLGHVMRLQNDLLTARKKYGEATKIYHNLGHRLGEASCLEGIGDLCRRLEDYLNSEKQYMEAMSIYRSLRNRLGEANSFYGVGEALLQKGDYDTAAQFFHRASAIYRQAGARLGEANTLAAQGQITLLNGEFEKANTMLDQANRLYLQIGDRYSIAAQTGNFGWLMEQMQSHTQARQYFLRAAELFTALGLREQAERHLQAANAAGVTRHRRVINN